MFSCTNWYTYVSIWFLKLQPPYSSSMLMMLWIGSDIISCCLLLQRSIARPKGLATRMDIGSRQQDQCYHWIMSFVLAMSYMRVYWEYKTMSVITIKVSVVGSIIPNFWSGGFFYSTTMWWWCVWSRRHSFDLPPLFAERVSRASRLASLHLVSSIPNAFTSSSTATSNSWTAISRSNPTASTCGDGHFQCSSIASRSYAKWLPCPGSKVPSHYPQLPCWRYTTMQAYKRKKIVHWQRWNVPRWLCSCVHCSDRRQIGICGPQACSCSW